MAICAICGKEITSFFKHYLDCDNVFYEDNYRSANTTFTFPAIQDLAFRSKKICDMCYYAIHDTCIGRTDREYTNNEKIKAIPYSGGERYLPSLDIKVPAIKEAIDSLLEEYRGLYAECKNLFEELLKNYPSIFDDDTIEAHGGNEETEEYTANFNKKGMIYFKNPSWRLHHEFRNTLKEIKTRYKDSGEAYIMVMRRDLEDLKSICAPEKSYFVPYDDILFYTENGQVSYASKVTGTGQAMNTSGAAIGGLLAGTTGAIVGASVGSKINISTKTDMYDNRVCYVYYKKDGTTQSAYFYNDCYKKLFSLYPEKSNEFINKNESNNNDTNDNVKRLKGLKELLDLGAITQAEYDDKKEQILKAL